MGEGKVFLRNESRERLVGLQTFPERKEEQYPAVVLVHGFGVRKEEGGLFDDLARHLSQKALVVFRFDFSGCGESEGEYRETSLSKLASDLKTIFSFVSSQSYIDSLRIGVVGQSFGTATILVSQPRVACMVLMSCVARPKETLAALFGEGYNPTGVSKRVKRDGRVIHMNSSFWSDIDKHDIPLLAERIACPALFIHGEADDKIPVSDMKLLFSKAPDPKKQLVIRGADRGLRPKRDEAYVAIVEWCTQHLGV